MSECESERRKAKEAKRDSFTQPALTQCSRRPEQTIPSPGNADQSGFRQSGLVRRPSNGQPPSRRRPFPSCAAQRPEVDMHGATSDKANVLVSAKAEHPLL